jgi:hypothetical protein
MKQNFLSSAAIALAVSLISGGAMAMTTNVVADAEPKPPTTLQENPNALKLAENTKSSGVLSYITAPFKYFYKNYHTKDSKTCSAVTKLVGVPMTVGGAFMVVDAVDGFSGGAVNGKAAQYLKKSSFLAGLGGVLERRSLSHKTELKRSSWYYAAYTLEAFVGVVAAYYGIDVVRGQSLTGPFYKSLAFALSCMPKSRSTSGNA